MPSFQPLSAKVLTLGGKQKTVVSARFKYGNVIEDQTYTFNNALDAEAVISELTTLLNGYQSRWETQQVMPQIENDVSNLSLEEVTI